jgi:hypothetical protein
MKKNKLELEHQIKMLESWNDKMRLDFANASEKQRELYRSSAMLNESQIKVLTKQLNELESNGNRTFRLALTTDSGTLRIGVNEYHSLEELAKQWQVLNWYLTDMTKVHKEFNFSSRIVALEELAPGNYEEVKLDELKKITG